MNARTPLFIVVSGGAVATGLLVVALQAGRSARALDSDLAAASARQAQLRADLQRTRSRVGNLNAAPAAAGPSTTAKPGTGAEPALPPRTRPPSLLDFAREKPELWNEYVQSRRAEYGRLYLPVLQRLNLSRQQQERFKDILAAEVARSSDLGAAADAQGLAFNDPALAALHRQSQEQRKRDLLELLGAAGYREFDAFERALPMRGYVDGLATQLASTVPLTAPEADQLERALAESNEAYRNGKNADPRQVDWSSADRRAREILSPAQFAVWELGTAPNPFGGSRRSQELQAAYDRAVKHMQAAEGMASR